MPHPLPSTLLVFLVFSSCSPVLQTDAASAEAPLTGAQFGDAVAAGADHHAHPRLLASHERFAGLLALSQSDPVLAAKRDIILKQAKSIRTRAPFQYIQFTDRPRNGDSLINRAYVLALAYLVTPAGPDRDDLRDALWSQLDAVTKFPDWNPGVCLDTADFAVAFAISYDWLYDAWTDDQRTELRGALYFMGVDAAAKMYRSSAASPPGASGDWVLDTSNHNVACNSGFATAAMALLGDVTSSHQAELVEVLSDAYTSLQDGALAEYAQGGYTEGMRYYDYSLTFLVPFLESLKTVSGSYQGLNASPGLAETGYFPIYMRGTSGETFNFFDAASGGAGLAEAFALGAIFDKPVFRWDGLSSDSSRSLLWYDPAAAVQTPAQAGLDPDRIFPTPAVVTMRGSWDDANATYVGFKAGSNLRPPGPNPGTGHGDLDQGTFVLDADGQRWAEDLGDDWYSLPGYFSGAPTATQPDYRWKYYRKRAEGQNTFVFDTSAARDQRESSNPISNSRFKQTSAWALADLTSTASGLVSWRRGVKLFDHRRQVVIRDEVTANANLDAWWFMHTRASISILEDGRSALLTLHGKQMLVRISGMPGATFFDMPALPLPLSPEPSCTATSCQLSGLYSNADFRKLAIHFVETRSVQLAVEFTPLEEGDTLSSLNARDHVLASTLTDWEHGSNEEARDTESRSIKVPDAAPSALDSVHLALHLDSQQRPTSVSCASVDANGRVYGANAVDYRYTSSDPTIVAVSNAGALTFMAKGRARIVVYATDEVTRQRVWNTLTVVSPL